jgi:hypothetical protein
MATATKEKAEKTKASTTEEVDVRKKHKVQRAKVKTGDIMALTWFVKVTDHNDGKSEIGVVGVNDAAPEDFWVRGAPLVENMTSADQYEEEIKVARGKIAEILVSSHNVPLTVCFTKQGSKTKGDEGEERVLRGKFVSHEVMMGRSYCDDFDAQDGRPRLVDHRSLKFLIVHGVKYSLK